MFSNPASLIYGTITVAALLAAESARQETYPETIGAVAVALVLYWLAHSYSEFTGDRLAGGEPFSYGALGRTAVRELSVLLGAAVPFVALVVCWIGGASLSAAVTAGTLAAAGIVIVVEVAIGVRAELSGRELVRQTVFGAVLGLLVIALRALLH